MVIFGVALLALCMLAGVFIGDVLGVLLHVKANIGGVGIAMMLLIAVWAWLQKRGTLSHGIKLGGVLGRPLHPHSGGYGQDPECGRSRRRRADRAAGGVRDGAYLLRLHGLSATMGQGARPQA